MNTPLQGETLRPRRRSGRRAACVAALLALGPAPAAAQGMFAPSGQATVGAPVVAAQPVPPAQGAAVPGVAVEAAPRRPGLYMRLGGDLGYAGYQYSNGRRGGGLDVGIQVALGFHLANNWVVGGTFTTDVLTAVAGVTSSGAPFHSVLAPAVYIGGFFGHVGRVVSFELAAIAGGGATFDTGPPNYGAGGFGAGILPVVSIWLLHGARVRFGLHARAVLTALHDPAVSSAVVLYYSTSVGASMLYF